MEEISNTPLSFGGTVEDLIPVSDRAFTVSAAYNGCGICARVCPVDNIEMADGRPVWQNRCENCLACVNWCPREAIQGGIANQDITTATPTSRDRPSPPKLNARSDPLNWETC